MCAMYARLRSFVLFLPVPLLILVLLLWIRSYLPEHFFIRSHQGQIVLFLVNEPRWFDSSSNQYQTSPALVTYLERIASVQGLRDWQWLGFRMVGMERDYSGMIFVPYWFVALLLAIPSMWWFLTRRARRLRSLPGHCRECGYDLRESHDKCPECGLAVRGESASLATSTSAAG